MIGKHYSTWHDKVIIKRSTGRLHNIVVIELIKKNCTYFLSLFVGPFLGLIILYYKMGKNTLQSGDDKNDKLVPKSTSAAN